MRGRRGPEGWCVRISQEPLEFFYAHADVGKNPAERSLGDIVALVHRDCRAASISVPHDVVAASHPGHLETGSF
jgi:hypothetical protein